MIACFWLAICRASRAFMARTLDDRDIVAGEFVLRKKLADFHFDEFEQFLVIDQVAPCS